MIYFNYRDGRVYVQTSDWDGIDKREYKTHEVISSPARLKVVIEDLKSCLGPMVAYEAEQTVKQKENDLKEIAQMETKIKLLKAKHKIP
jgi:hypothetical protein